ncbi:glutaminyl-peptide cyclotransferase [Apibacter sp. B2966]|uniref:glutaminyl-peptide cyclotransferase n=1 Tax=Apibacter sp. B2966 TaxID=2656761 RepID=UPI00140D11DA|nr:glutaminyl-peptide cyclotransferase [Apibacter sp. B2966]QII72314.1 glutaminyl-peptide cyclotransferase [Apibacter sp. B2966]
MKNLITKLILCLLIVISIVGCKDPKNISISTNFDKLDDKPLHIGDKLPLEFNTQDGIIDSYSIKLNDQTYDKKNITLDESNAKLGTNYIVLTINYNGKYKKEIDATFTVFPNEKEKDLHYKLIQEFPHNPELFTQGFTYKDGWITESSGLYGKSLLVKYKLGSTSYSQSVKIDPKFFAEGFALLNEKLYLLTWREKKGFIYNASDFKLLKEFNYPGTLYEGWGATTIGDEMVVSDGSSELKFYDKDFNLKKTISVIGYENIYSRINELEYANGFIYANVFDEPIILKIDPSTGIVVAKADFSDLVKMNQTNEEAVLNGIAYVDGDTFLITGKLWSKIYKVEFTK